MVDSPPSPCSSFPLTSEWWKVTLASIGDAVITTDELGRVVFLNPVAEIATGWTLSEATGQPLSNVFRIVNEESRQTVENPATKALREGVVVGLANHSVLIDKLGVERPIDDSAAPIRNAQGDVAGVVLVFRDTTERKRQEHLTESALAFAENVISSLREPYLVLDPSLRVVTANRAFYETFRTIQEETEGTLVYDLGDGQWNIPRLRHLLEKVLPHGQSLYDFHVEHEFPSIGQRTMVLNADRVRNPAGHSELILLAIEDTTARRRSAKALEASETKYRRLFETAQDAILILDADTERIVDANPFIQAMLGYSHAELVGKELWQLGVFEDRQTNQAAFRELKTEGYIRFDHLPLETKGGKSVDVEFVSNVYAVDHTPIIQCNIRDITERRVLEQRTREQAEALADLHRRKDEFLAMLSHELRNPLAPIANAVHLLRLEKDGTPLRLRAQDIIERQLAHLTRLVDDLLEVSRVTTGRVRLLQEPLALAGVIERAVQTARALIDVQGHELTVSVPLDTIWIYGDATRLEQVVVNLLTNAAKYTDTGGQISLSAAQEGEEAVIRVRDTGIGIAPELLPRIFDLFTQAEPSLDRSQGGLGIGLALVHQLVGLHGGRVAAYSSSGQGSEFVVYLPVLQTEPSQPESPPIAEAIDQSARSVRVLVVDDSRDMIESFALLLQQDGYQVRTASDGPEALEASSDFRPDVIMLDIGLPGMDGYEVAKRIREQPASKDIVLVALTGYGQESDRKLSRETGFDHHLVKPLDFRALHTILAGVSKQTAR